MTLQQVKQIIQHRLQLIKKERFAELRNYYSYGKLMIIELQIIYPNTGSFTLLKYVSSDGKNFKNCLESRKGNNNPSLFDRSDTRTDEEKERERSEYFRQERKKMNYEKRM